MDTPSASLQHLARHLLAIEAAGGGEADPPAHEAVRVCEKLRVSLTRFAGPDGFASLLRRALAMARVSSPSLQAVTLLPDGSVRGLDALATDTRDGRPEAAVALISHLLGLLVTFIGEPLTRRLVLESWPEASLDE